MIFNNLGFGAVAHDFSTGLMECVVSALASRTANSSLAVKAAHWLCRSLGWIDLLGSGVPVPQNGLPMVCPEDILELACHSSLPRFSPTGNFHRIASTWMIFPSLSVMKGSHRTNSRWNRFPTLSVQMLRIAHVFGFHVLRENLYRECNAQVSYGGTPELEIIEKRIAEVFPILRIRVVGEVKVNALLIVIARKPDCPEPLRTLEAWCRAAFVSVLLPRLQL